MAGCPKIHFALPRRDVGVARNHDGPVKDDERRHNGDGASLEVGGRISLFGYDPTPATLRLRPRSRSWRVGGSVRTMALALLAAPVVGLIPPHAPWVLGALAGGGFLARRRWTERFTVLEVEGTCPRCGEPVKATRGRLRSPHPVLCESCHYEASVDVPPEALDREAGDQQ